MRDVLLRLFGAPRPIVIEFAKEAIAHARPGDVVVFTSPICWSPEILASIQQQMIPDIQREAPGVAFLLNSPEWQATVVPASLLATGEGQ